MIVQSLAYYSERGLVEIVRPQTGVQDDKVWPGNQIGYIVADRLLPISLPAELPDRILLVADAFCVGSIGVDLRWFPVPVRFKVSRFGNVGQKVSTWKVLILLFIINATTLMKIDVGSYLVGSTPRYEGPLGGVTITT